MPPITPDPELAPPLLTNYEIGRRFSRIGDILEIQGENPFKVKAYRRAAETIDDLAEPLHEIAARNALADLPGFGEAIVAKTQDFLRTGTTRLYEQIKDKVPSGVVAMAAVSGVGPKTVRALWEALGVDSVDALLAAAQEGRVQTVAGFGASKEKGIIEAIERARRLSERTPLYIALPYAQRLVRELLARPEVTDAAVAGSLRRGRDTVGDIDLVAATTDPAATAKAFATLPGIGEIIASGEAEVAGFCDLGLRVDLRMGGPAEFPALLHHFSSGRDHNRQLREWAEGRGLKINEYGVTRNGTVETVADETALYALVGLPLIPPELREGRGEIAEAAEGRLTQLITEADFRGQLHCHSTYSDGGATVRDMALAARARGYEYLAITDHSASLIVANGVGRDRMLQQLDEIAALNETLSRDGGPPFTVLTGQEVDILADGSLDADDDILARLDVVVGSVHIRHKENEAQMTERILRAIASPHLDILGHPTGRLLGRREPFAVDMEAVIHAAIAAGVVLEINAAPERMDLNDAYARHARDLGAKFTINADAHSIGGLGLLPWGLFMARRAGLTAGDVINTLPLDRLRQALRGKA